MAMAGYDPREAVSFWKRMAGAKKGASPPEFLSTHPADSKRIADIEKLMPEAMGYYQK
jgi:predicted Zn-dependent protease